MMTPYLDWAVAADKSMFFKVSIYESSPISLHEEKKLPVQHGFVYENQDDDSIFTDLDRAAVADNNQGGTGIWMPEVDPVS